MILQFNSALKNGSVFIICNPYSLIVSKKFFAEKFQAIKCFFYGSNNNET